MDTPGWNSDLNITFRKVLVSDEDAKRMAVPTGFGLCNFTHLSMEHMESSTQLGRTVVQDILHDFEIKYAVNRLSVFPH